MTLAEQKELLGATAAYGYRLAKRVSNRGLDLVTHQHW